MEGLLLFLAFLFVAGFPSANLQAFDGLPLSRLCEFGALVLIVPFLIFPDLRARQMVFWKGLKIRPAYLWAILAAVLLLKGILLVSGAHTGFSACYRSPAEPTTITHEDLPRRECERSYENLFDRFAATRLDSTVWFQPDTWNLVFLNTTRYNYYDWDPGNIPRARIPLEARWEGVPDADTGDMIRIEYVGEGTVAWGGTQIQLPASYGASKVVEFTAPSAGAAIRIDYGFNDGSRTGQDPESWGPRATIKISAGKPDRMVPLAAAAAAPGWQAVAWIADGLILLWLISFLPALIGSVRRDLLALIVFSAGAGLLGLIPFVPVVREILIAIALAAFLTVHLAVRPFHPATIYVAVIVTAFAILHVWTSGSGQVLLRSAGNDPLTYESQAYSILFKGSLEGGDAVFYQQPMFRYILFVGHAFFGDGDVLYSIAQLAVFFGGIFWLFRMARKRTIPTIPLILLIGLGCSLVFLGGYYVSNVIRDGLSEYDTWILLLWSLPALYWYSSSMALLGGSTALAISYTIRSNQILGILWILCLPFARAWRKHEKSILLAGVLTLGIALLPLIHNLYYGHQWVLMATSGDIPANLTLPPSTWFAFLKGDPSAGSIVRDQIGMMFLIAKVSRSILPTLATMALILISWILVTGYWIIRRGKNLLILLVTPLFYLAPHFFYQINNYYPRHIVIAYLSMAIVTVLVLIRRLPDLPIPSEPAVE